jgi:ubiquinone/menaquinone biosynthesis C-methylase UbiE
MKPAFDHCADDYARYRPGYPDAVFETLAGRFGPPHGRTAADVGAGTGIFASRLAAAGWRVVALEPSVPMLRYAIDGGKMPGVAATAEAVPLADGSVHLVTAAQAAHWFNPRYVLPELARVLRSGGGVALVWNNRDARANAFVDAYETLVER